jgi:hypothetical protein
MISPIRKELLESLERLSELTPDVRFGQLIANLSYMAVDVTVEAVWDMEDEQCLEAVRELTATLSARENALKNEPCPSPTAVEVR